MDELDYKFSKIMLQLKNLFYFRYKAHTLSWPTVHDVFRQQYNNILAVMDLPVGSSECERGFSKMKALKTSYRNNLKSSTMTLLLTIQLHSPDVSDFDPTTSIHQWNQGHHHRPNFMDRKVVTLGPPVDLQQMELSGDKHTDEQGEDAAVAITTPVRDSDYDSSFSDLEEHDDEDSDMSLSAWFFWSNNGLVSTVLEYEDAIAYKKRLVLFSWTI